MFAVLVTLPFDTLTAAGEEFYRNLLRRGIAQVESGDHSAGVKSLRIAAFGLVDSVDEFETAHIYLAIAHAGLKHDADARHSAQRVLAAERVARRYAALTIPQPIRARFEIVAGKVLTSEQVATLHGAPPPPPTQPSTMVVQQRQTPPPASTGTNHRPVPSPQPATPAPQPKTPQPSTPRTQQPVPQPTTQPRTQQAVPQPAPQPAVVRPTPQPPPTPPPATPPPATKPAVNVDAELAKGDRALENNDLAGARKTLGALIDLPSATHAQRIRIAEGLTRARDFAGATKAFGRVGAFQKGEEPYRFYYAVALYETGDYPGAKRELDAALPFIENTLPVASYRVKIERASR